MQDVALVDLLKAGVHFGHQRSRWHPKMAPYIFTVRNGICIIDLEKTAEKLQAALNFVRQIAADGGKVIFVGTKRQAREIVLAAAQRADMPSVTERWVGGTFTNFNTVSKILNKLTQLKEDRDAGRLEKYTKKERLVLQREIDRLEKVVGGIEHLDRLPQAVFIIDLKQEKTVLREAMKMKIPIVAIADTNVDPTDVEYPIPANDDATKSIMLITNAIADAVIDGQKEASVRSEAAAKVAAAEAAAAVEATAALAAAEAVAAAATEDAVPEAIVPTETAA